MPNEEWVQTSPWGIPEDQLKWVRVDNGARYRTDHWRHWFRLDTGRQVCGSYVRGGKKAHPRYPFNLGRRCGQQQHLYPNGRCKRHNGKGNGRAPIHGGYMQLRGPLKEATARAEAHESLLDLRPLIALFDLRVEELSSRMDSNAAGPEEWSRARTHWQEFRKARKREDKNAMDQHAKELSLIFDKAHRTEKTWGEMLSVAERRLRRTEKAQALLIASANMVTAQDIKWLFARITNIVNEESNGTSAQKILDRLAGECASRITPGGGEAGTIEARGQLLPRVQGEGTGVLPRDPGGEVLGGTEGDLRRPVQASLHGSEDVPRPGEDESGSGSDSDVPVHEEGRDSGVDGSDRSPGTEPPVGGDRSAPRPRKRPRKSSPGGA